MYTLKPYLLGLYFLLVVTLGINDQHELPRLLATGLTMRIGDGLTLPISALSLNMN